MKMRIMMGAGLVAFGGAAQARQCGHGWSVITPLAGTPPTWGTDVAYTVYDSARGRILAFGQGSPWRVWEFDPQARAWTGPVSAPGPAIPQGAAFTFDPVSNRTLLFGGEVGGSPAGQMWAWDGAAWAAIPDSTQSANPGVVYHSGWNRLLSVGGERIRDCPSCVTCAGGPVGTFLGWDGAAWSFSGGPTPLRALARVAYQPQRDRLTLVGGRGEGCNSGGGSTWFYIDEHDTWEYRNNAWVRVDDGAAFASGGALSEVFAFPDAWGRELFLERVGGELREWDGAAWELISTGAPVPPGTRLLAGERIYVVAGSTGSLVDVWARDIARPPLIVGQTPGAGGVGFGGAGGTIDLSLAATFAGSITYEWRRDGVTLVDGGNISGATTNHLVISPATCDDLGEYIAFARGGDCGFTMSDAWVVSSTGIVEQPTSRTEFMGASAQFHVEATPASGGLTHQWRKGGAPLADGGRISGATTPTLTIRPARPADNGSYDVVITGATCGDEVTSAPATLQVVTCHGDGNGDGVVTFIDLNHVLSDFGQSDPALTLQGDVTGDGVVNFQDLNLVIGFFGTEC